MNPGWQSYMKYRITVKSVQESKTLILWRYVQLYLLRIKTSLMLINANQGVYISIELFVFCPIQLQTGLFTLNIKQQNKQKQTGCYCSKEMMNPVWQSYMKYRITVKSVQESKTLILWRYVQLYLLRIKTSLMLINANQGVYISIELFVFCERMYI